MTKLIWTYFHSTKGLIIVIVVSIDPQFNLNPSHLELTQLSYVSSWHVQMYTIILPYSTVSKHFDFWERKKKRQLTMDIHKWQTA